MKYDGPDNRPQSRDISGIQSRVLAAISRGLKAKGSLLGMTYVDPATGKRARTKAPQSITDLIGLAGAYIANDLTDPVASASVGSVGNKFKEVAQLLIDARKGDMDAVEALEAFAESGEDIIATQLPSKGEMGGNLKQARREVNRTLRGKNPAGTAEVVPLQKGAPPSVDVESVSPASIRFPGPHTNKVRLVTPDVELPPTTLKMHAAQQMATKMLAGGPGDADALLPSVGMGVADDVIDVMPSTGSGKFEIVPYKYPHVPGQGRQELAIRKPPVTPQPTTGRGMLGGLAGLAVALGAPLAAGAVSRFMGVDPESRAEFRQPVPTAGQLYIQQQAAAAQREKVRAALAANPQLAAALQKQAQVADGISRGMAPGDVRIGGVNPGPFQDPMGVMGVLGGV
jgi:hypothetical protein